MVVDDDPATLELAVRALAAQGHAPTPVNDGETALFLVSVLEPDLILLDVAMPGMDGFKLLRALRDDPKTGKIPVVMMTASTDKACVQLARDLGALDYITKPIVPADLVARAGRAVAKAQTRQGTGRAVAWA
jgi:CheY-like chemotaxis protein